ncbi:MAG: helix-hairpin-helix domain-containing protein [Chloroflexota bacterium]
MARSERLMLAAGACALAMVALGAWLLLGPSGEPAADASLLADVAASSVLAPSPSEASSEVVVDVEGAVAQPGLRSLPAGSRLADAISAAGGYGPDVDLPAAAQKLNLATPLADGQQIYVPRLGDATAAVPAASGGGGGAPSGGGLVDLNSATPEELDALPGIGPVTVQKIVAARQEKPFASLDDAVQRGVLNSGQLEKIRDLATAG